MKLNVPTRSSSEILDFALTCAADNATLTDILMLTDTCNISWRDSRPFAWHLSPRHGAITRGIPPPGGRSNNLQLPWTTEERFHFEATRFVFDWQMATLGSRRFLWTGTIDCYTHEQSECYEISLWLLWHALIIHILRGREFFVYYHDVTGAFSASYHTCRVKCTAF